MEIEVFLPLRSGAALAPPDEPVHDCRGRDDHDDHARDDLVACDVRREQVQVVC
jgi:hypothetical protein